MAHRTAIRKQHSSGAHLFGCARTLLSPASLESPFVLSLRPKEVPFWDRRTARDIRRPSFDRLRTNEVPATNSECLLTLGRFRV